MLCSNLDVLNYKASSWKPQKYKIWILDFFLKTDQTWFYAIFCFMQVFCGQNTFQDPTVFCVVGPSHLQMFTCLSSRLQNASKVPSEGGRWSISLFEWPVQNEMLIYLPFIARQDTKLKRDFLSSRALPIIRIEQIISKFCHKIEYVSIIFMRIVY